MTSTPPSSTPGGRLRGTVALITGASSGIGEATALALAAEGADVALVARRRDRLEALVERLNPSVRSLVIDADITDEEAARAAIGTAVDELGRLDVLVNNAGVMLLGRVNGAPVEEWRRMIEINVVALLPMTHAALPHLIAAAADDRRGVADVVNVSSVAGRVAFRGSAVYNATKFGVGAFSEALRQEVAGKHVRVSLVEPGGVDTELYDHIRPDIGDPMKKQLESIDMLQPSDIADAVAYAVTRPRHVAINEQLVRPTQQVA